MATFVMATHNPGKLEELRRILAPLHIDVVTAELDEVEETGTTFAENAFLKADAACRRTGLPAVADDSGLMVDALDGAPGVYSARYAGEGATDLDRIHKLLANLEGVPAEKRTARFVSAICCMFPDGTRIEVRGECPGVIADAPRGNGGFGYDPVFLVGEKSFGELTPREKDAVSHRGKALRALAEQLRQKKGNPTMLTGKQRAYLRSLANEIDTIVMIGKSGIGADLVRQADDALTARELIKAKVLETAPLKAREAAEQIAEQTRSEVVQVIGSKFVLYRRNAKEPKIVLPLAPKK